MHQATRAAIAVVAVATLALVPSARMTSAATPGIPSFYVEYNEDCTFTMRADGGTLINARSAPGPIFPPGVYQISVFMPNPSGGHPCKIPRFTLSGPGVTSVSVFPGAALNDNHMLPALQPSSTYTAEEDSNPAGTRVYFSTSATGSSSSLAASAPGSTSSAKASASPGLIGSSVPVERGALDATITETGQVILKRGTHPAATLRAGHYELHIVDGNAKAALFLARPGRSLVPLTGVTFVGSKTRSVTLTRGTWTFSAGGKTTRIVVTA